MLYWFKKKQLVCIFKKKKKEKEKKKKKDRMIQSICGKYLQLRFERKTHPGHVEEVYTEWEFRLLQRKEQLYSRSQKM